MESFSTISEKRLLSFILKIGILYLVWYFIYELILKTNGRLDQVITINISQIITGLLKLSGIEVFYTQARKLGETYLFLVGETKPLVRIGSSCNGLEPIMLFLIFILAYPGRIINKIWFIPVGIIIIHTVNIMRNYLLIIMLYNQSELFEFFHRYIFVIFVYLVIFALWMLWVNHFSFIGLKGSSDASD